MMQTVARTCCKLKQLLQKQRQKRFRNMETQYLQLIEKAIAMDKILQQSMPDWWPPGSVLRHRATREGSHRDFLPDNVMDEDIAVYVAIQKSMTGNCYRAARINLLSLLSSCLSQMENERASGPSMMFGIPPSAPQSLIASWAQVVRQLAKEVAGTVPIVLGQTDVNGDMLKSQVPGIAFRGFSLLWPLRSALEAPSTANDQKEILREHLNTIGEKFGIGLACGLAQATDYRRDIYG
jgi:hypothetical protein